MRLKSRAVYLGMGVFSLLWGTQLFAADQFKVTVKGPVKFERRATVVPQMVCVDGEPCFKSKPYWVVSLSQDGVRYEMSQSFHLGSESPPESVEISGVRVREGSHVRVTADIEAISTDYAIVTDVIDIEVLSGARFEKMVAGIFPLRVASGWFCRSRPGMDSEYQLKVWYGCANSSSMPREKFQMILEKRATGALQFRKVARFEDLSQEIFRHETSFSGQAYGAAVQLKIKQGNGTLLNIPADFTLIQLDPANPSSMERLDLDLECTQDQ